jgi:hypothetical protein
LERAGLEPATFAHGRPPAHVQLADGSDAPVTVNGLGGGQTEQVLADFLWPQEKRLFFGTLNFKNYFWIFAVFVGFFELINIFILDFLIIYFGIFTNVSTIFAFLDFFFVKFVVLWETRLSHPPVIKGRCGDLGGRVQLGGLE